ncbi:MAG: YggT family protein [Treponema sp.]
MFIRSLLTTISQLISIYSFLCLIRIIISWIPQAAYSSFGQVISSICDPYLNWFRRFRFTQIGIVDFSPILALGVLSIASQLCTSILATGQISLWIVFIGIIELLWSFFSFVTNLLIIFLVLRLLYDIFNFANGSPFWYSLDRFLNPVISQTMQFVPVKTHLQYRAKLIITIIAVVALRMLLGLFVGSLFSGFHVIQMA